MTEPPNDIKPPVTRNQWLGRAINVSIAIILVVVLVNIIDFDTFADVLGRLSLSTVLAGFIVFVLLNLWRTLRYLALLDRDDLPIGRTFIISFYHNMMVRLLPFKLGELTYVVLMRNRLNVPPEEGLRSLFGSRLGELLVIILVFSATLLISSDVMPNQQGLAIIFAGIAIVGGIVGFYYSGAIGHFCVMISRRLFGWLPIAGILDRLDALATDFERFQNASMLAKSLLWSCFSYASSFALVTILLMAVGVDVSLTTLITLISISMFASAVPFNIAGFGTVEIGWTASLVAFAGYTAAEAASIGLMINSFMLLAAIGTGILSFLWLNLRQ